MSDTPTPPDANPQGGAPQDQPSLTVLAQYLKDLSFENPRAPGVYQSNAQPKIDVNVDVQGRALNTNQYEVELSVSARANRDNEEAMFVVEASYAGVFEITGVPREQLEMVMLVECPRLLFPFMRQIVADATRNGNFPPLMLEPIDFMSIYVANAQRRNAEGAQNGAAQNAAPEGQA
ncbi:protein-export chaperone SecB [Hyphococcus luteus]|jgi:preprotein translocase subunit SecB|uniref:Protein-export protein SecB n=1 Tax=Hyphococcus luteus TaxID=2058213 RepID=A0A2S7K6R2_9PROT|nr:protein-export chaperone SecB [Marinicaulis flavus]PQA88169.1 protein-export chaperone SecB [Marinicaulis flavus]